MKKAGVSLIALSLVLPGLFSCSPTKENATLIPLGQKYDSSLGLKEHFIPLEYGLFENFLDTEKTFVLLVQGDEDDCICYYDFCTALTTYMKKEDARIYHIKLKDLTENHGIKAQSNANAIAVFKKGKLVKQCLFKDSDKTIKDQDAFNEKMDYLISWNDNVVYVNKSQLDALYSSDIAGFTVLFARESCSDCSYMFSAFFEDYALSLKGDLYIYDVTEERNLSSEEYQTFKDEYGLSSVYSEYGYSTGVVPTFQYVVPGTYTHKADLIKDAAVYANDSSSLVNNEYQVTGSYWSGTLYHEFLDGVNLDSKLLGKTIPNEQVTNGYWSNEYANDYHEPLIKEFLKFYVGVNE